MARGAVNGIDAMVVVVPAHNEAELIGDCLAALRAAIRRVTVPVAVRVVLDACRDDTAERLPDWVEARPVEFCNVGAARAAGFVDLLETPGLRIWLATTDADSQVPPGWLLAQLDSAAGNDLFVGTVLVTDWSDRPSGLITRHELGYHQRAGHRHVHGASLGVRLSAYQSLGGFSPLPVHEDVALVRAATAAGLPVDWSAAAPVRTSARRLNRTPGGFAAALNALEEQLGSHDPGPGEFTTGQQPTREGSIG